MYYFQLIFLLSFFIINLKSIQCQSEQAVPILQQASNIELDGSYQWSYQSADGTVQQQIGQQRPIPGTNELSQIVQGGATWYDPNGEIHQLSYVADENGYQPQSPDIPPIPPAILRSLEWNAAHPEEEQKK